MSKNSATVQLPVSLSSAVVRSNWCVAKYARFRFSALKGARFSITKVGVLDKLVFSERGGVMDT